ncbi:MAG: alkaline phosphatase D family protein, partial [Campylobacterota bacterium]|nr:alkaline phosphatase D family protein [Campylobacterota bacterium]
MSFSTRREFLKISALSACALVISTGLSGCGSDDSKDEEALVSSSFNHGVASGDPLSDKVIIWTHVTSTASSVNVAYEVATDKEFTDIIHNGVYATDASKDFTVKIDIQNLDAGTTYYYRFSANGTTSALGKMKTLAEGSLDSLKMAVFSCANYTNGYFNPYMEASELSDLDVTLHLGDYIYEYGIYENDDFEAKVPAYATSNAETINRLFPEDNNKECLTLSDYRKRYALYHTDRGLQALHAAAPMIAVWDDHEVANDTYKEGAQNHQDDEGVFADRVEAALQAYFEWLPIRPIDNKKEIYRTFNFGNLVSLNMLETRIFGRDKQLDYGDYFTAKGSFLEDNFKVDVGSETRTMMGASQLGWLQGQMASSTATWQVL